MQWTPAKLVPRSAPAVLGVLLLLAIVSFAAVGHLVNRFNANQQARGRRFYAQGLADVSAGNLSAAVEDFRAALTYDPTNSQYQLSLGRVLRDTGRLDEAEAYLLAVWERTPQGGPINLALGRVAARRGSLDDALRYYHNAIYGVWGSDADANRRRARIELIEFLLQKRDWSEAQSELVALAASLPPDPALHLQAAAFFAQAQDYRNALSEYEQVIRIDHSNSAALAGAGEAAYRLGRFRSASRNLQSAVNGNPQDSKSRQLLQSASLILQTDPFVRRISDAERNRRITAAFFKAGDRLKSCAQVKGTGLGEPATDAAASPSQSPLTTLAARWSAMKPDLRRLRSQGESDLPDAVLDLVLQIEQETAAECGQPEGVDLALLLISRNREVADQ
ncbi:MAG: tetratricopeptide repeat protein [Acidobacteriia bacterium]|nr:tetratricopeptide repeat protein [Terriglobia bacterium]